MRFSLLLFLLVAILVSSCHHSDFHKSHYPKFLKHSRNLRSEKDAPLVSNLAIQESSAQFSVELQLQNDTPDSIETQTIFLEDTLVDDSVLTLENSNTFTEIENSRIYLEKNQVNYSKSNSVNQTRIEEEPNTEIQKERKFNKKSLQAFWMVWIMFVVGVLIILVIVNSNTYFFAGLLLLGVIVGCIFTIITAIRGAKEISNDRANQKGTALSVLAILGSVLGLFLSGLLLLLFIWISTSFG
jgi:cation transport ATPase